MSTKCKTPYIVKNEYENETPVPCGYCENCLRRRQSNWTFRIYEHAKHNAPQIFATLTYSTEKVPITSQGFMSSRYKDVQDAIKRIRKRGYKISYVVVTEYGTKTQRPHYHMLLFGCPVDVLHKEWPHGYVHFGDVSLASIQYCLKYMLKPVSMRYFKNDDREPCKARVSKGIGRCYLTQDMIDYHTDEKALTERVVCHIGSRKISMPRYYKEKIYNEEQKELIRESNKGESFFEELVETVGENALYVYPQIVIQEKQKLFQLYNKKTNIL